MRSRSCGLVLVTFFNMGFNMMCVFNGDVGMYNMYIFG